MTAQPAAPGRLSWHVATLTGARWESATARTLTLDVPGWPGHRAGQHVDVKLTAEDGYTAQRSYSIASAPDSTGPGPAVLELTVQRLADGEVSPYLTDVLEPGDQVELRGPIGGWFVWDPSLESPLQLIAGGSGIVPLMAMIRAAQPHAGQPPAVPLRLVYSARTLADVIYSGDLAQRARAARFSLSYALTRAQRPAAPTSPSVETSVGPSARAAGNGPDAIALRGSVTYGRISSDVVAAAAWEPQVKPAIFICGPSGFVDAAADLLIAAGHDPAAIKTERFGATGQLPAFRRVAVVPGSRSARAKSGQRVTLAGIVPRGRPPYPRAARSARQPIGQAELCLPRLPPAPGYPSVAVASTRLSRGKPQLLAGSRSVARGTALLGLAPRRRRRCWR